MRDGRDGGVALVDSLSTEYEAWGWTPVSASDIEELGVSSAALHEASSRSQPAAAAANRR